VPAARAETAPAKVNLTLRVIGRRADGYHEIESLVVFADIGDTLTLAPARALQGLNLEVRGPTAAASGTITDNLVIKAAGALADRVEGLKSGRFVLSKRLPVAAGVGGGSSDAAAALRLLAHANRVPLDDSRLYEAARAVGADVPVCLVPRARVMRGIGEVLSPPLDVPRLPAVLVNPRVAVPTRDVFAKLAAPQRDGDTPVGASVAISTDLPGYLSYIVGGSNDLEAPAISLQPAIAGVLDALRKLGGCRLSRMSGSGATCFGLFGSKRAAMTAAAELRKQHPQWWVRATTLG
jgi:4-diphosphocytidyl-2-C-methyl-D-erythritol kinase